MSEHPTKAVLQGTEGHARGGNEFTLALKGGQVANEVSDVSIDLATKIHLETIAVAPRTASILTISWPDRYKSICSRVSMGSSVSLGNDADIIVEAVVNQQAPTER